jgi:hypothetical protein
MRQVGSCLRPAAVEAQRQRCLSLCIGSRAKLLASILSAHKPPDAAAAQHTASSTLLLLFLQDPCTWRIVLKNTVDLELGEVQEVAREKLDALVLSYQHLDSLLDMAREGNPGEHLLLSKSGPLFGYPFPQGMNGWQDF